LDKVSNLEKMGLESADRVETLKSYLADALSAELSQLLGWGRQ